VKTWAGDTALAYREDTVVTGLLRRWHITVRIVAIALIGGLTSGVLLAVAVSGFAAQRGASGLTEAAMRLSAVAMEAKFRTADVAGWQTGYAFDFNRGVPGAADDTVGQRKQFLASATVLRSDYAQLASAGLSADEAQLVESAQQAFEKFMTIDTTIVQGYRTGTAQAVAASNDLASGASLDAFGAAATATSDLAAMISDRGQATAAADAANADGGERTMWIAGVIGLLLLAASATAIVRSIAAPLTALRVRLLDIADGDGDLRARLAETGHDELTVVSSAVNRFIAGVADTVRVVANRSEALATQSQQLTQVAGALSATAAESADSAATATRAADEISGNVATVAAGTEEMSASIGEIARSTNEAVAVAGNATEVARTVTDTVTKLNESGRQIGEVAKVINSIAEQTNLLALNATIEAARAGDAGKGFAVVASEVKDLAQATGKATGNIEARISAIQNDTASVAEAIGQITEVIDRINGLQAIVASAVEEQSATTAEMGRSITEASTGSSSVARDVATVADSAGLTTQRATDIRSAADDLAGLSGDLRSLVGRFRF
jgi:methyl-accepting chemotaxis protein